MSSTKKSKKNDDEVIFQSNMITLYTVELKKKKDRKEMEKEMENCVTHTKDEREGDRKRESVKPQRW